MYKIDVWTNRGIVSFDASTKREANAIAERARANTSTMQTVVTRPNGVVKICRNKNFKA